MSLVVDGKNGIKYGVLSEVDLISQSIAQSGEYEPELQSLATLLLKGKIGLVIDVGANIGTFSLPVAKMNPAFDFICFEVQKAVFLKLSENINRNQLQRVKAIHCGLSNANETVRMSIPDYTNEFNIGAFSLDSEVRDQEYEVKTTGGTEIFNLFTLDRFELNNIQLIKIDVEGMEQKVIEGACKTLASNNYPPVIFEAWTWKDFYKPRREALLSLFSELGYDVQSFGQNNLAQHRTRADRVQLSL